MSALGWGDVKAVLREVAPVLGTALGGPLGGVAATVVASALDLGATDANDPSKMAAALAEATPDQLLALQRADQDFRVRVVELGNQDRAGARERELTAKDWVPKTLAIGITAGFFGLMVLMLLGYFPQHDGGVVQVLLGSLGSGWTAIIAYYFGSSAGSDAKTKLLAVGK